MELTSRSFQLIIDGVKTTGELANAWQYREEDFYLLEIDEVKAFCQWLQDNIGGVSGHNIDWLYRLYQYPDNPVLQQRAQELKDQIRRIRKLTGAL